MSRVRVTIEFLDSEDESQVLEFDEVQIQHARPAHPEIDPITGSAIRFHKDPVTTTTILGWKRDPGGLQTAASE